MARSSSGRIENRFSGEDDESLSNADGHAERCAVVMAGSASPTVRILLVHPRPTRGGFTALVSQAVELSQRTDFEVFVASNDGPRLSEVPASCSVTALRHPLKSIRGMCEIRNLVSRVRPEVVHFHGRQAGLIGRLAIERMRIRHHVLYTPHGTPWVSQSFWRDVVGDLAERLLLRRTAAVHCVSHHEVEEWSRREAGHRIRYMPNALSFNANSQDGTTTQGDSSAWSDSILVPSGYNPQKRVEIVIEALALVPEPRPFVTIAGPVDRVDYRDSLKILAAELGVGDRVCFRENLADIRTAMRHASLVILPSFSEGRPIVGQEAIAEGARVAWSRIGAHAELFGETGAPFWNAAELAAIMVGNHREASVAARRPWLIEEQRRTEKLRSAYWDELRELLRDGPP